jgi:hypothetical protein
MRARIAAVVIALASAAIMTLGLAPMAMATSDNVWERLAGCESGHRWHIATGNGYYGGLQISSRTWRGYGGNAIAPYPHNASREGQIIVAERILHNQGWKAWPTCSRKIGVG